MSIPNDNVLFLRDIDTIHDLKYKELERLSVPLKLFRHKDTLTLSEILLYSMVLNHYDPVIQGVIFENCFFSDQLKLSESQVRKIIKSLSDKNFLRIIKVRDKYYVKRRLLQPKNDLYDFFDIT